VTAIETPARAGRREWIGLAVLSLACVLYVMDLTVLYLALPAISADLQPTSAQLLWIIDSYGFFVAGALITMGTLGDRIGRRRLLLLGAAAFGLVSILAAVSPTAEWLIASRALLGIAGATLAPSTLSLIFHMFQDARQRSVAVGFWIASFSVGEAIGPLLGGVMLEHFWWGSVFLLALPVIAALLIVGPRVLPEYRDPDAGRLDLASAAMSVVAVLAVIFGLKEMAQDGLSALAAAAIVAGLAVAVGFVLRQRRLTDPMIDVGLFRRRGFDAALTANFLAIFIAAGYFLFVAQYLQLVIGLSPLEAGLWSLPSAVAFIIGSQLVPRLLYGVRPAYVVAGGLALASIGLGLFTQVGVTSGLVPVIAGSVIISVGLAPVFGVTTELIVGAAPPEQAGAASGISETASELGGALGIAILGSVGWPSTEASWPTGSRPPSRPRSSRRPATPSGAPRSPQPSSPATLAQLCWPPPARRSSLACRSPRRSPPASASPWPSWSWPSCTTSSQPPSTGTLRRPAQLRPTIALGTAPSASRKFGPAPPWVDPSCRAE
jgi:MFS transporter, DHA2 family, multidrug resistance protein